ncbi:MAG: 16S rRNA (adenine(1518)-N(6)/adenine(1519)-N(6))-dimethyltransferase RsmA [Candidatus Thiodiazotropha sp.]
MNHRPRKRFGQNFLHDPGIIQRIVNAIDPREGDNLVEIGPGQGAITLALLPRVKRMQVVEIDRDLVGPLAQRCQGLGELTIHNVDALKFDFRLLAQADHPLRVVGNLPYNISTPLLFHLFDSAEVIRDFHLMLQKEVVERMAAGPGSKTYGRLSVMLQARARVQSLFHIGPGAFNPPPKVDSAFVRLQPIYPLPYEIDDWPTFSALVAQAFSQRRKTLRNSLRNMLPAEQIEATGLDPGIRPEQLSVAQFCQLANRCYVHSQEALK